MVGQDLDMSGIQKAVELGLANIKFPEIETSRPQATPQAQNIEVFVPELKIPDPVIVEKIEYREVEKQVIVEKVEYKEIEKPVIIEKVEYKEIEKPIIIYQQERVVTPKLIYIVLGIQIVLTLIAILK
jgi:hypothetical protein